MPRTLGFVLLFLYVALTLARVPEIVWPGRFWAEEGSVYFRDAYMLAPREALLSTSPGYYILISILASQTAAHAVPLRLAPVITMLFALAVQLLPAALLLFARTPALSSRLHRVCGVALLLVVQPNQAVWLNTINSQFHLCVAAAIILISEPSGRGTQIVRLGSLALAGLTGVVSCLLLPFFLVELICTRAKHRLHECIVLAAVAAIQAAAVLSGPGRETYGHLGLLAFTLLTKQWILPVLGCGAADAFAAHVRDRSLYQSALPALLALLPYAALGAGLFLWGRRHSRLLLAASLSIASVSFLESLDAASGDLMVVHLSAFGAGRYYYAPNVLLALAMLLPTRPEVSRWVRCSRLFRRACLATVALTALLGSYDFLLSRQRHRFYFRGPSWPAEVGIWEEKGGGTLRIWPKRWTMELPLARGPAEAGATPDAD